MHPKTCARLRASRRVGLTLAPAILLGLGIAQPARAGGEATMRLDGTVETTAVSGFRGTPFTFTGRDDLHAVYGLVSAERRDNPCYLDMLTESINDPDRNGVSVRNFCGGNGATSSMLKVAYEDTWVGFGKRVFVSGIRVCMNNDRTRVKGFQIRGRQITSDGRVLELDAGEPVSGQAGGSDVGLHLITMPRQGRSHCDEWMGWASCPQDGQIATGLVAHFEAGNEPRSLTGIALQCRVAAVAGDHATRP